MDKDIINSLKNTILLLNKVNPLLQNSIVDFLTCDQHPNPNPIPIQFLLSIQNDVTMPKLLCMGIQAIHSTPKDTIKPHYLNDFFDTYIKFILTNVGKHNSHTCKRCNYRWYYKKHFTNAKANTT